MNGARELTLDLPHLRLAARAWGDPSLPPLLALHGWLDNAASFDRLAPLLCEHFHIVALDLPGHGRSGHRPAGTLVGRGVRAVDGGFVWSSDPRLTLASPMRYIEAQILALLDGIRAPTLLILAQPPPVFLEDRMINARIARVPGIEVVRMPGHHHLHLEDPAPVAAAILASTAARMIEGDVGAESVDRRG